MVKRASFPQTDEQQKVKARNAKASLDSSDL